MSSGQSKTDSSAAYRRIAAAIDYLLRHQREQPSLADLAAAVHISPQHLQRLFTQWAGVSPKKFLQYLTLEHAKSRLATGSTVEEAALAAGLSGSGRLHDLFTAIDGMTPGEFRNGGEQLQINTSLHETRFGTVFTASTQRGLCALSFADTEAYSLAELRAKFPRAAFYQGRDAYQRAAIDWLDDPESGNAKVPLHLQGTPFQLKVWESLLQVPAGRLTTYGQLAMRIGQPSAARAVGSAVGSNPVALLIPCHRVIRASGALGGYRWGAGRKAALIGWESARQSAQEG